MTSEGSSWKLSRRRRRWSPSTTLYSRVTAAAVLPLAVLVPKREDSCPGFSVTKFPSMYLPRIIFSFISYFFNKLNFDLGVVGGCNVGCNVEYILEICRLWYEKTRHTFMWLCYEVFWQVPPHTTPKHYTLVGFFIIVILHQPTYPRLCSSVRTVDCAASLRYCVILNRHA